MTIFERIKYSGNHRQQRAKSVEERFWEKVAKSESGCWEWLAARSHDGYGYFRLGQRCRLAHRVGFVLQGGVIPDGLELDHLCRNPGCVRREHLEPVTYAINRARGFRDGPKAFCIRGHLYAGANVYIGSDNKRRCKECNRIRARIRLAREHDRKVLA